MTHNLPSLRETIEQYGLLAKKSLGQHFLLDPSILTRIAGLAGDVSQTTVIEIGPGPGGLTRALLHAGAQQLFAVEKDARCVAALAELQAHAAGRLRIIEQDALEWDAVTHTPAPRAVVANLPYNIASVLLVNWLHAIAIHGAGSFSSLVLMFQKEVAERLLAAPRTKDYGRLSVLTQWLCKPAKAFDLPPGAFLPPPKVESSVVVLRPREAVIPCNLPSLEKLLAAGFGQRRKMLRQSLKSIVPNVEEFLAQEGVLPTQRAEEVSVEQWARLAQKITR